MLDGILIGYILCVSMAASLFFLKFWHSTRDPLFIAFAIVIAIEGISRLIGVFFRSPDGHVAFVYFARMTGYVVLIASIVYKNRSRPPR